MIDLTAEESSDLRERLYHAVLLTFGGVLLAIADLVAEWLVGLFSATLPLPSQAGTAVATLVFAVLVYVVAVHIEPDDDRTLLAKLLDRENA